MPFPGYCAIRYLALEIPEDRRRHKHLANQLGALLTSRVKPLTRAVALPLNVRNGITVSK
jgi:hypothetical protein